MQITYKTKELEKVCNNSKVAAKKYGRTTASRLRECISALESFDTVDEIILRRVRRCHALHENRAGQYAMDLEHPLRLVFTCLKKDVIQIALILEITDYH